LIRLFQIEEEIPCGEFKDNWGTVFTPIRIFSKSRKNRKIKHGVECGFLKLTNDVGIKMFYKKSDAVHSHKFQKRAHRYNVGPKVLSDVFTVLVSSYPGETCFSSYDENRLLILKYAYKTEVATTKSSYSEEEYEEVRKKLKKARISTEDLHEDNIGILKGGVVVCVDFGPSST